MVARRTRLMQACELCDLSLRWEEMGAPRRPRRCVFMRSCGRAIRAPPSLCALALTSLPLTHSHSLTPTQSHTHAQQRAPQRRLSRVTHHHPMVRNRQPPVASHHTHNFRCGLPHTISAPLINPSQHPLAHWLSIAGCSKETCVRKNHPPPALLLRPLYGST